MLHECFKRTLSCQSLEVRNPHPALLQHDVWSRCLEVMDKEPVLVVTVARSLIKQQEEIGFRLGFVNLAVVQCLVQPALGNLIENVNVAHDAGLGSIDTRRLLWTRCPHGNGHRGGSRGDAGGSGDRYIFRHEPIQTALGGQGLKICHPDPALLQHYRGC